MVCDALPRASASQQKNKTKPSLKIINKKLFAQFSSVLWRYLLTQLSCILFSFNDHFLTSEKWVLDCCNLLFKIIKLSLLTSIIQTPATGWYKNSRLYASEVTLEIQKLIFNSTLLFLVRNPNVSYHHHSSLAVQPASLHCEEFNYVCILTEQTHLRRQDVAK